MKQVLTFVLLFIASWSYGQDHLVKERFNPLDYERNDSVFSTNHRFYESWGLNTNIDEDDELIKVWGSNAFTLSYKYNVPLFLGVNWNIGIGYNWDNYKLKPRTDMFLHDSISHEKVKLRIQNVLFHTGLRFQSSKELIKAAYLEFGAFARVKTFTKYTTWDEVSDMKLKSTTRRLNYIAPFHFGAEARIGYGLLSIYGRYRISDIFESGVNYRELPRLSLGIVLEMWNLE